MGAARHDKLKGKLEIGSLEKVIAVVRTLRIAGDRIGDGVLDYFDAHQRVLAKGLRLHGDKRHQCSCKYKHRHRYNWSTSKFLNPWPAGQKCPARRLNVAREPTSASTIFKARFKGLISFRDAVSFPIAACLQAIK